MGIMSEDDMRTTTKGNPTQNSVTTMIAIDKEAVPRVGFRWIVQNNITSDTDLAILSNVCRDWRTWLVECLVEQSVKEGIFDTDSTDASAKQSETNSSARHLLLPSMMRAFVAHPQNKPKNAQHSTKTNDHFCVAWFASEGIQELSWTQMLYEDAALEKMILEAQDSAASRDLTDDLLETNHSDSEDSERKPMHKQSSTTRASATIQRLEQQALRTASQSTFQWKRNGTGIVLSNEWRGYREPLQVLRPFGYTPLFVQGIFSALSQQYPTNALTAATRIQENDDYSRASFAVRGVTVARPESYCLCLDRIQESHGSNQRRLQRLNDRKDLRRTVLPRVLKRGDSPPVVQFLNVDKSSAVTLMTPALACGTLQEPFTIFLVGIATEDGCFLSGLRHRFEIGHLYPRDQLAEITDSSAICILTEDWTPSDDDDDENAKMDEAMDDQNDDEEIGDEDCPLDDSSKCSCIFDGVTEKLSVLEEHDEKRGRLVRGVLGPGAWRCYTVVVDGLRSIIRIDGVQEPMEICWQHSVPAFLDGLTLGSDHCFGTSLCCGQGSPGEGEGAMAEVAVFAGRMATRDIVTMENHLMKKHAISPQLTEPWRDDDLYRQARAMFQLVGNPRGNRVPLRYFTKSPNVAWTLSNPVTKQIIKRDRIGARNDETSSEW